MKSHGIQLDAIEQTQLFSFLRGPASSDISSLSKIEAYSRGHLFLLNPQTYLSRRSPSQPAVDMTQVKSALTKIALSSGVQANDL